MDRRSFLLGLGGVVAAPAIVKIANIMPVRNRLIVPASVYDVPQQYTFSCYLKGDGLRNFVNEPNTTWETWSAAGNDWWRYSVQFSAGPGERKILKLPIDTCWGAQMESPAALNLEVALQGPSG